VGHAVEALGGGHHVGGRDRQGIGGGRHRAGDEAGDEGRRQGKRYEDRRRQIRRRDGKLEDLALPEDEIEESLAAVPGVE
jgi:hypothetical protein